jgi:hypothetical protein
MKVSLAVKEAVGRAAPILSFSIGHEKAIE